MASHHQLTVRPRSLANILDDLRHARRDYDDATSELAGEACKRSFYRYDLTSDRVTEAETRMEDLRSEFADALTEATGLTFEALMKAREGCLL
jgi:hypothetical protein